MKRLSRNYRERLGEYLYFARDMVHTKYRLYSSQADIFSLKHPRFAKSEPNGLRAAECMFEFESKGKLPPCREGRLLAWYLAGKSARDWHIEQWSDLNCHMGIVEMALEIPQSLLVSVSKARAEKWRKNVGPLELDRRFHDRLVADCIVNAAYAKTTD